MHTVAPGTNHERRATQLAALLVFVAILGCGGDDAPLPGDSAPDTALPDAAALDADLVDTSIGDADLADTSAGDADASGIVPSLGCTTAPPTGSVMGTQTIDDFSGGGRDDRVYVVTFPEGYDHSRTYALTLGLHPGGQRARPYYDLDTTMARESINVYPESLHSGGVWDKTGDDDLPYLDDLVGHFLETYCIDESRVFVGGFSQGARMAATLGCRRGDIFRAVAALSSGPPGATMGDVSIEECVGQTAYFHINGLDDPERRPLLEYYIEMWQTRNGCESDTAPFEPDPCVAYEGCDQRVVACEPPGLAHQNWRPGGVSPFGAWFLAF